ncbi:MAG: biotin attachment protein [Kiritimatiellae bacterium]|nr:biotin attachment protein [Kiritimatiellia bacterium]
MAKKTVKFMLTAFRDGFQSVVGARVLSKDFLPCVEEAYAAGVRWFEAGGGARFQSCYFYCQEDAFDVMDKFRAAAPEADLQTLSRGVNVVGLESQSSDMIKLHAQMFKKHGMSSIRNFDALNDVNNLKWSGQCIHDAGLNHEVVVTMMGLPPGIDNQGTHTPEFYRDRLRMVMDAGIPFDRVCFKDASGTSTPTTVYNTMKLCRQLLGDGVHIQFHSHETAGNGVACYLAALRGGADGIDLSMAPMSGGTCQPDIITMWHCLDGDPDFGFDFDIDKIKKAEDSFKNAMQKYFLPPEAMSVNPQIVWSPMPGGALTANTQMLRDNNMMDKYDDMIAEMYDCVRLGGFGTSVTPVSQFYAQQAIQNVMFGKFKKFAPGYAKMVLGYFGKTPVPPDPEIVRKASEFMASNELTKAYSQPTTKTVLELNDADPKKGGAVARKALEDAGLPVTDENVFIAASCKEKGILFLKDPSKAPMGCRFAEAVKASATGCGKGGPVTVTINGKAYGVELKGDGKAVVNGKPVEFSAKAGLPSSATAPSAAKASEGGQEVKAPVPGTVLRITAQTGTKVAKGDEILVMDVMKMETPVTAPCDGTVTLVVAATDKVATGDVLATIG